MKDVVNRQALGVVTAVMAVFLVSVGTGWGGTLPDAHDRALPQGVSSPFGDAHDRGDVTATRVPDGKSLRLRIAQLDAHARAAAGASSAVSRYRDAAQRATGASRHLVVATHAESARGFSWQAAGIGAGAALAMIGLIAAVALVARHERRLAAP